MSTFVKILGILSIIGGLLTLIFSIVYFNSIGIGSGIGLIFSGIIFCWISGSIQDLQENIKTNNHRLYNIEKTLKCIGISLDSDNKNESENNNKKYVANNNVVHIGEKVKVIGIDNNFEIGIIDCVNDNGTVDVKFITGSGDSNYYIKRCKKDSIELVKE